MYFILIILYKAGDLLKKHVTENNDGRLEAYISNDTNNITRNGSYLNGCPYGFVGNCDIRKYLFIEFVFSINDKNV